MQENSLHTPYHCFKNLQCDIAAYQAVDINVQHPLTYTSTATSMGPKNPYNLCMSHTINLQIDHFFPPQKSLYWLMQEIFWSDSLFVSNSYTQLQFFPDTKCLKMYEPLPENK